MDHLIIIKWINDQVSDEEVAVFKTKIYELFPSWANKKIGVIQHPHYPNQYLIILDQLTEYIVGTVTNDEIRYEIKEGSYRDVFPNPLQVDQSFTKTLSNGKTIYLVFGKITGLHFLHWECCNAENTGSTYNDVIYKSEEEWQQSIELVKSKPEFHVYPKESVWGMLRYLFAADDMIDYRYEKWFLGEWKNYENLGLKSVQSFVQPSKWMMSFGELQTIEPFSDDELFTYKDFMNVIHFAPNVGFYCDHCRKYIPTQETYFAKTNRLLNLCKVCFETKVHNFEEEFETIRENNGLMNEIALL